MRAPKLHEQIVVGLVSAGLTKLLLDYLARRSVKARQRVMFSGRPGGVFVDYAAGGELPNAIELYRAGDVNVQAQEAIDYYTRRYGPGRL